MSNQPIRPSTLDGIKRYAKTLKTLHCLTHAEALDAAASAGGFQNFAHARNVLAANAGAPPGHLAYISVMWRERETKANGQEVLTVRLAVPLAVLVKPAHLKAARGFGAFKMATEDHLAHDLVASSRSDARRRACAAARTLEFMQATGLRPSSGGSRAYPRGSYSNAMPGHDHSSSWFDPVSRAYVYVDEPYQRAVDDRADERQAWADRHGWIIARSAWAGMYNPDGGCELYMAADKAKGFDIAKAISALDSLPAPFFEKAWDGRSEPMFPPFFSPAATQATSPTEPRPRARRGPNATVGYRTALMRSERRRPSPRMPIDGHTEVGRLLKSVIRDLPAHGQVYKRLNSVRSDLDDWVQCEYNRSELSDDAFFDLYYHEHDLQPSGLGGAALEISQIAALDGARNLLTRHYPDCAPVRGLLGSIDRAIAALRA